MESSLETVEFLARSESRVEVLEALEDAPRTRDDLKGATEASRTTLSRMLSDFEDRGWVTRPDRRYQLTPEGRFVASEVTRLLENMDTATKLDGALRWLPTDAFDFDLRRLRDAEVVTLEWNDPASMRGLAEQLQGADRVQSIATGVSREVVDILRTVTVEDEATYEGILTEDALETVRAHPNLSSQLREIAGAPGTSLYVTDTPGSLAMVMRIDELAAVCNHGSGGPQMEAVLSEDDAFGAWVETYFESVRADADPLDLGAFAR